MPEALRVWLAARLEAVTKEPAKAGPHLRVSRGRGTPPEHAESMHDRSEKEAFQDRIAWAVFHALRVKEGPLKGNRRDAKSAPQLVSEWANNAARSARRASLAAARDGRKALAADLGRAARLKCTEREARRWYEERLSRMRTEQAKLDEVLKAL